MITVLLMACLTAAAGPAPAAEPPRTIPVVTGWKRLLDQPPIRLGERPVDRLPEHHVCRLGISAASAEVDAAVVVWVAVPGEAGFAQLSDALRITVEPPTARAQACLAAEASMQSRLDVRGVDLFGRIIGIDEVGVWRIRASTGGVEVAVATVEVRERNGHPWQMVRSLAPPAIGLEPATMVLPIQAGPADPATISPPELQPWLHLPEAERLRLRQADAIDVPLPHPDPPPTATVRLERGWLAIDLPAAADAPAWRVDSGQLLARWWRDGQPWTEAGGATDLATEMAASAVDETPVRRLRLPVDWTSIPPGTPLAVEFLWSATGSVPIAAERMHRLAAAQAAAEDGVVPQVVARTQRLEFAAP